MNYAERAGDILDIEIAGLQKIRSELGDAFNRTIEHCLTAIQADHKIVITGLGKCLHVGQKIASTLTSTGSPAVILHPSEAMHGDLGVVSDGDILLALSYSGESEELLALLNIVKRFDVTKIAMTGVPTSALAVCCDVVLPVTVEKEACPFNMAPTASTTVMLAVGDALAMVLLEARGFGRDDYAKLHPGGAIGRTLLLKVEDIMRTGDRLATVTKGAKVKDAVLAMTSARSGSVAVVDEDGTLIGIVTDGDLRRHITDQVNISSLPIEDIMTPDPVSLKPDQLAVDVLAIFEKKNIDDLVVVQEGHKPVGLIDIQDLPKFKIL